MIKTHLKLYLEDLLGPVQQLVASRHTDALVLQPADAKFVDVVTPRAESGRPLPLEDSVSLRLQPDDRARGSEGRAAEVKATSLEGQEKGTTPGEFLAPAG